MMIDRFVGYWKIGADGQPFLPPVAKKDVVPSVYRYSLVVAANGGREIPCLKEIVPSPIIVG